VSVAVEIGAALLVWTSGGELELGFSDEHYDQTTVRALFEITGDLPQGWRLDQLMIVANDTL
jgi:predicted oxidoreductase (fatty acid repression mutant protein)